MSAKRILALLFLFLMGSLPVFSESKAANAVLRDVGNGTTDQTGFDTDDQFEITASSDSSQVSIRIGRMISEVGGEGPSTFKTFNFTTSAPINKSSELTDLANQDGLANAFKASLALTWFNATRKNPFGGGLETESAKEANRLCDGMKHHALLAGEQQAAASNLVCETGNFEKYAPALLDDFEALFWDRTKTRLLRGFALTVGHQEFSFLDPSSLEERKEEQVPWSVKGFIAWIPQGVPSLITLGVEYQDNYKEADKQTICPPAGAGATNTICKTGSLSGPTKKENELVFLGWRRLLNDRLAFSLMLVYNFENDVLSADLPIFFVRDDKKALRGGVRFGWRDDSNDLKVGVFVGKAFNVFE